MISKKALQKMTKKELVDHLYRVLTLIEKTFGERQGPLELMSKAANPLLDIPWAEGNLPTGLPRLPSTTWEKRFKGGE